MGLARETALACAFCLLIPILQVTGGEHVISPLAAFKDYLDKISYDNSIPPVSDTGEESIHVQIGIYLNSVGDIDERNQEYNVNMYLRQLWRDARLNYTGNITGISSLALTQSLQTRLWVPDPFFENAKSEIFHTVTVPNSAFRVYPDGTVFYSQRLTVKLWCTTHLETFPMDNQTCYLKIMTFRYTTREMHFSWMKENAVERHPEIKLARFTLGKTTLGSCTQVYTTGGYSCVLAAIHFQRQIGYYLIRVYIPTGLIVILSWVSFWLDPLAVPARISLGVVTVLTMSTQMASATSGLPQVSYIKAVDVWSTTCMLFLFSALIEFAIANSLARQPKKAEKDPENQYKTKGELKQIEIVNNIKEVMYREQSTTQEAEQSSTQQHNASSPETNGKSSWSCNQTRHRTPIEIRIDRSSRVLFPVLFLLFNAAYWSYYTGIRV